MRVRIHCPQRVIPGARRCSAQPDGRECVTRPRLHFIRNLGQQRHPRMSHRQHLIPVGLRPANFVVDLDFQAPCGRIRLEDTRIQAAVEEEALQAGVEERRGKQPRSQSTLDVGRQTIPWQKSNAARAMRAMTRSRAASFRVLAFTYTDTASRPPFGNAITPLSFVAAVKPFTVPLEPVLCATIVPAGNNPFSRPGPVVVAFMISIKRAVDGLERTSPRNARSSSRTVPLGVPVSRGSSK